MLHKHGKLAVLFTVSFRECISHGRSSLVAGREDLGQATAGMHIY